MKKTLIVSALFHIFALCLAAYSSLNRESGGIAQRIIYVEIGTGHGTPAVTKKAGNKTASANNMSSLASQPVSLTSQPSSLAFQSVPLSETQDTVQDSVISAPAGGSSEGAYLGGNSAGSGSAGGFASDNGAGHSAGKGGGTSDYALIAEISDAIRKVIKYPEIARRRGLEGTVVAEFYIGTEGMPEDIAVIKSSGYGVLDKDALLAIKRAAPYQARSVRVEVPVIYKLKD